MTERLPELPGQSPSPEESRLPELPGQAPSPERPGQPRSGLRDPARAVRGVAAGTLALELIVVLLAVQPIAVLGGLTGARIGVLLGLAACCGVLAGVIGRAGERAWPWAVATALQVAITATGFFQWALFVLGAVFLLIWLYVLTLRRDLRLPAAFDH